MIRFGQHFLRPQNIIGVFIEQYSPNETKSGEPLYYVVFHLDTGAVQKVKCSPYTLNDYIKDLDKIFIPSEETKNEKT